MYLSSQETQSAASGKHLRLSRQHPVADVRTTAIPRQALDCHQARRRHILRAGLEAQQAARNRQNRLWTIAVSCDEAEEWQCKDGGQNWAVACSVGGGFSVWFLEGRFWQQRSWAAWKQLALPYGVFDLRCQCSHISFTSILLCHLSAEIVRSDSQPPYMPYAVNDGGHLPFFDCNSE